MEPNGTNPPRPRYEMRPRSLGELLDATFGLYRANFWVFAGLGSVAALLQAMLGAVQLLPMHLARAAGSSTGGSVSVGTANASLSPSVLAGLGLGVGLVLFVLIVFYLLIFVVTQAATVYAVGEVCLGRTTTITAALKATMGRWYRYLGVGLWQGWSALWIPGLVCGLGAGLLATKNTALMVVGGVLVFLGIVGGLPVGVILWLRNALGVQAAVIEGLTVRASMRRSKVLTPGAKGKVFVLMLLAGALNYVASLLQLPLMLFVMFTLAKGGRAVGTEIVMLVISFLAHAVVQPVAMVGLSLIYFDQRMRNEGLDLELMLQAVAPPAAAPLAPAKGYGAQG